MPRMLFDQHVPLVKVARCFHFNPNTQLKQKARGINYFLKLLGRGHRLYAFRFRYRYGVRIILASLLGYESEEVKGSEVTH